MPDDFFKKLPNFGKIKFGTAKVHYCQTGVRTHIKLENHIISAYHIIFFQIFAIKLVRKKIVDSKMT
jgi:hypothetical protein